MKKNASMCIVIMGPTIEEAKKQIIKASKYAEILEFRLDQIDYSIFDEVKELLNLTKLQVVFTYRKAPQIEEENRREMILKLVQLGPSFIDLEHTLPQEFFKTVRKKAPKTKIICSYHNLEVTPTDLNILYNELKKKDADIYKIATMANSILDSQRMLIWLNANRDKKLIGLCMGELGQITRILAPIYSNCWTYASLEDGLASAPGQLNARTLLQFYNYKNLNSETKVYGLIGNPISQSPSHFTHNFVFNEIGINAIYVKFKVKSNELKTFINNAKQLLWNGFSVTIPHKEKVLSLVENLDEETKKIGAINTLKITNEVITGCNTDRMGALDVLERKINVKGKKMILLGAGGSGKAIAFEANKRGAELIILNRTPERAKNLAKLVNAKSGSLIQFPEMASQGYDILVNSTSVGKKGETIPGVTQALLPKRVVMDIIIKPKMTPLLHAAKQIDCELVYGLEMFMLQASLQFNFWFGDQITKDNILKILEKALLQWENMQ